MSIQKRATFGFLKDIVGEHFGSFKLTRLLARLDDHIATVTPFTPILGVARTLAALGSLLTLALTPTTSLFFKTTGLSDGVVCNAITEQLSLFCMFGEDAINVARVIAIVILAFAASGLIPAITAIPHWWVTWSFYNSSVIPDGGDHVAAALTLLLVPVLILDRRPTHWHRDYTYGARSLVVKAVAHGFLRLIVLQLIVIYTQAAIAKLSVEEWANGTAMWYWLQEPTFGPRGPVLVLLQWITASLAGVVVLTYGALLLELALAIGVLAPRASRGYFWLAGVGFHFLIGITFGLWSFFCSMSALLILGYIRPGRDLEPRTSV